MTTEQQPAPQPPDAERANVQAEHREACDYWGYLIKEDKCGTAKFDRLLRGIADVISREFEPHDNPDLTPSQLAGFYRAVGGNYDVLFIETPPTSISFIYKSLGAFHSLQPAPEDDGYSTPSIPALKKKGFVTWQTIQLLLGPEEHVPFLQKAVELFDIKDPEDGSTFPKVLPKECFPDHPDDAMEAWYETVADRLKREAEADAAGGRESTRVRVEVDDHGPRTSSEVSDGDERHGAATYFSDPLYRKARTRPQSFVRRFSKQPTYADDRGTGRVVSRVRHMLNPLLGPRRRTADDSLSEDDATPVAPVPPVHPGAHHRYPPISHKRPHPPRRDGSVSSTDSNSDSDGPPSRRRSPVLRHQRSHEPHPPATREYFPNYYEERRYSHDVPPPPPGPPPEHIRKEGSPVTVGGYGPTKAPLTATYVAQAQQAQQYQFHDRRPAMPGRGSYRPNVRYTAGIPDAERYDHLRDRSRDAYDATSSRLRASPRDREWERDRARRKSEEYPRERRDSPRTRSHDRVKEDWDERDRSRDRDWDRERDRDRGRDDRDRVRARYVPGVQDGVSGRRYPVDYGR